MNKNILKGLTQRHVLLAAAAFSLTWVIAPSARAQFTSGSNGTYGPIDVPENQIVTLQLPDDGVFHTTTITIAAGGFLKFNRNAANTPVYLLATGDVIIHGVIDISGKAGGSGAIPSGGIAGPGGFDGGNGPMAGPYGPGDGYGPGGGKGGTEVQPGNSSPDLAVVGHGSFGTLPTSARPNNGSVYGNPLLIPLVGGSGGGGGSTSDSGHGGGGGGGAVLIASNTSIKLFHLINASGGSLFAGGGSSITSGSGSGGAVRLVAPRVDGTGSIYVFGGSDGNHYAGAGRIRIDTMFKENLRIYWPVGSASIGGNMVVFPPNLPKLEIIEAAGMAIDPTASGPVSIQLPSGAPAQQTVKVRASNFGGTARVKVVLTPDFGPKLSYDLDIENPGPDAAIGTGEVVFPENQLTRIDVWTR